MLGCFMHDEILERTVTDSSLIGTVFNSLNSKELQTINVGKYFNSNDTTTFIPTFEEVLEYCLKEQIFMNIEIKPAEGKDIITSRIVAEKTLQYYSHLAEVGVAPMFSSFSCFKSSQRNCSINSKRVSYSRTIRYSTELERTS